MSDTTPNIFKMTPEDLLTWLEDTFSITLPASIETPEDMEEAAKLLSICSASYSFLLSAATRATMIKRNLKRAKVKDRREIDDAMSREEALSNYAAISKQNYQTISRMITVHIQAGEELKMMGGMP